MYFIYRGPEGKHDRGPRGDAGPRHRGHPERALVEAHRGRVPHFLKKLISLNEICERKHVFQSHSICRRVILESVSEVHMARQPCLLRMLARRIRQQGDRHHLQKRSCAALRFPCPCFFWSSQKSTRADLKHRNPFMSRALGISEIRTEIMC